MSADATAVMQTYNFHRGKLPLCHGLLIKERKRRANDLLNSVSLEQFEKAIKKASQSSTLLGYRESFHKADFDWFLNPANIIQVLEGKYDDAAQEAPMRSAASQTEYFHEDRPKRHQWTQPQLDLAWSIGRRLAAEERRTGIKLSPTEDDLRQIDQAYNPEDKKVTLGSYNQLVKQVEKQARAVDRSAKDDDPCPF